MSRPGAPLIGYHAHTWSATMDIVTADTITPAQIRTLRDEAAAAGDTATVALCWEALAEWPAALIGCAEILNAAAAEGE